MQEKNFISDSEVFFILNQYNPWWNNTKLDLPHVKRKSFNEIKKWILNPPTKRALILNVARQVGKTTLIQQTVYDLVSNHNIDPNSIYQKLVDLA